MDAAGPDDDKQPIIVAVQDRLDLASMSQHGVLSVGAEGQVPEDLRRRDKLDHTLDPPVADAV
jgi:hypothetical protein